MKTVSFGLRKTFTLVDKKNCFEKNAITILTPSEYLSENYEHLLKSANNISGHHDLAQESLHYAIEEFLGKRNVIEIVESGGATFYIVAILLKCWRSRTSTFYRKHLASSHELFDVGEETEEDVTEELFYLANKKLEKLHWYDRMLWQTFVDEGHTISSLARATGIPRTSVSLTINRVRKYLQSELRKTL